MLNNVALSQYNFTKYSSSKITRKLTSHMHTNAISPLAGGSIILVIFDFQNITSDLKYYHGSG